MRLWKSLLSLALVGAMFAGQSQDILINEVMTSNFQTILDEDGDTPDWIELYNIGDNDVDLIGYSITDDASSLTRWTFPNYILSPNEHLLIYASDKNRSIAPLHWETTIDQGDEWRYIVPTEEPDASWRSNGFDDSSWLIGPTGIGYGDGDDNTVVDNAISVFLRKSFVIENASQISDLLLHIDYDDAFIAYINGNEIARGNINGDIPAFDTEANEWHSAVIYKGGSPEYFEISNAQEFIVEGQNVMSVQVHNYNATSSDMTIIPILSLGSNIDRGGEFSEFISIGQASFHTDFKLASGGDTLMLFNPEQEMVDSLFTGDLSADISLGRTIDGSGEMSFFSESTPGASNEYSTGYNSHSGEVEFSISGGVYGTPIQVELSTQNIDETIYYTLDGTMPSLASSEYSGPLDISTSTNLQAQVLSQNSIPGKLGAASYLIGVRHDLPVVSLTVDPYEFFDDTDGMYMPGPNASADFPHFGANFWEDWERRVHVELFEEDGSVGFSANAGAKIFGNYSRGNDQKSLSLFFRKGYGDGPIKYQLFKDKELDEFSSFVIRNSGNDNNNTMMRDGLLTSLFHESVDRQGFRPAAIYINGEYFGIQNIREKINEHYIANNHNISSDDVEIVEGNGRSVYGNEDHYNSLIDFVQNNDLSDAENYEYVKTQMDVMNYIYYTTGNIFIDNRDWPGNNIKYWRENSVDGKWRWIAFDTDFGFGIWDSGNYVGNTLSFALDANGPGWPNPPWATLLLRSLMENEEFRNLFINTYVDQLNEVWTTELIQETITDKSDAIANEIEDHMDRWNGGYGYWLQQIDAYHNYATQRPYYARRHIIDHFELSGSFDLTVDVSDESHGKVRVNTLSPQSFPWTRNYMHDIPVELEAIPSLGYEFVGWIGLNSSEPLANVRSSENTEVKAVFEKIDGDNSNIVINEILYSSPIESEIEDWVELFNVRNTPVDVSGWELKDEDDEHGFIFPENTVIASNGYLVVCKNVENFNQNYNTSVEVIGDLDFGLSSGGDCVRLFDNAGAIVSAVCYEPTSPWPEEANGLGATLALKNPVFDNSVASNWYAYSNGGNPGIDNSNAVTSLNDRNDIYEIFNYPNPFQLELGIEYSIEKQGEFEIVIYDMQGREIETIIHGMQMVGKHKVVWHPKISVNKGMYLVKISGAEGTRVSRVIYY
ncbi:MAG: CotH kinase family protein [Reichenbachiella sp.]